MAKAIVTKAEIIKVANNLISKGINPTVLGVRKILGAGSTSTINKYLREWKQEKLSGKTNQSITNLAEIKAQLQELQANLQQQQIVNQELLQELYKEQQSSVKLEIDLQSLQQEKASLNLQAQELSQNYALVEAKYNEVTKEREIAWQIISSDKQQQICFLQQELFNAHKKLKDEVLELAYQNQESLLAEKLKVIKQGDLNNQLKDKIKQLNEQNLNLITEKRIMQDKLASIESK